jgi:hypothetical protein
MLVNLLNECTVDKDPVTRRVVRQRLQRADFDIMSLKHRRYIEWVAQWLSSNRTVLLKMFDELQAAYTKIEKLEAKCTKMQDAIKILKPHAKHFRVGETGYEIVKRITAGGHGGYFWKLYRESRRYEYEPDGILPLKYHDPEAYEANLRMLEEGVWRKKLTADKHLKMNLKEYLQVLLERHEAHDANSLSVEELDSLVEAPTSA